MVTCRVRAWALGGDPVDLVVVAVHEGDPGAGVVRVSTVGLGEDLSDHARGVGHDAGGQPLVRCHRSRADLGAFGVVGGQDVRAAAWGWGGVEHGAHFGEAFPVSLLSLRQPGRQLLAGLGGRGGGGRAQRVGPHHDTFAVAGQHERVTAGARRWLPLPVEPVGVGGGSAGELFDLAFADLLSGAPLDRLQGTIERPT